MHLFLSLVKSSLHIDSEIDHQHKSFSFDVELKIKMFILNTTIYITNYIEYQEMLNSDNRMDHLELES